MSIETRRTGCKETPCCRIKKWVNDSFAVCQKNLKNELQVEGIDRKVNRLLHNSTVPVILLHFHKMSIFFTSV